MVNLFSVAFYGAGVCAGVGEEDPPPPQATKIIVVVAANSFLSTLFISNKLGPIVIIQALKPLGIYGT